MVGSTSSQIQYMGLQRRLTQDRFSSDQGPDPKKAPERVAKIIKESTDFFGYSVTQEQLMYCSNKNTAGIDFNLLRFAVYHNLRAVFIV